ncbi:hypothetical protein BOTCAL_0006g00040 [Botryotinia calthae]|uniref:Uncharacterized protein n=1 Tax=Botryotinia calthae TaxID=38488 RepID=A0A4Y8DJN8_9HELO|nr:hypothetical protein BOTCAL_0006g00040 [Botryotinia calthae]
MGVHVLSIGPYKCDYQAPHREMPRFVPPIKVKFAESEIDDSPVQPVLGIEEDAGAYMLVGSWEDVDRMEMEMGGREASGEGVKVRDGYVKEMSVEMEGGKEEVNKESNAREEHEGKHGRRRS